MSIKSKKSTKQAKHPENTKSRRAHDAFEKEAPLLQYVEQLSHILPYELVKLGLKSRNLNTLGLDNSKLSDIVGTANVVHEDGAQHEYLVKRIKTDTAGLAAFVLFSNDKSNPRVNVLFKGTSDIEGWERNLTEDIGHAGLRSFAKNKNIILQAIEEVVGYKHNQDKSSSIELSVAGHSLGGADSQMCAAALLEYIADKSKHSNIGLIKKLNIMHANAAGVNQKIFEVANKSINTIRNHEQAKKIKNPLQINQYIIHVDRDPVQQAGTTTILHDQKYPSVHTKLYHIESHQAATTSAWKQGFNRHVFTIFDNGQVDRSRFNFSLYDNKQASHAQHLTKHLTYKMAKTFNFLKKLETIQQNLESYKEYSAEVKYYLKHSKALIAYLSSQEIKPNTIPMISEARLKSLMTDFTSLIDFAFSTLQVADDKMQHFYRVNSLIKDLKEPIRICLEVYKFWSAYNDKYSDDFTEDEIKCARLGMCLMTLAVSSMIICSLPYMLPTVATSLSHLKMMQKIQYLALPVFKEGLYLCKIALKDKKHLQADSYIVKYLEKVYHDIPIYEQNFAKAAKHLAVLIITEKLDATKKYFNKLRDLSNKGDYLGLYNQLSYAYIKTAKNYAALQKYYKLYQESHAADFMHSIHEVLAACKVGTKVEYANSYVSKLQASFNKNILPYMEKTDKYTKHQIATIKLINAAFVDTFGYMRGLTKQPIAISDKLMWSSIAGATSVLAGLTTTLINTIRPEISIAKCSTFLCNLGNLIGSESIKLLHEDILHNQELKVEKDLRTLRRLRSS